MHPCMTSIRILNSASLVIHTIEEFLAEQHPYNHDFPEKRTPSIQDCEFPERVEDPFDLIRLLRGDKYVNQLEYEDHLEVILSVLSTCLSEELKRRGLDIELVEDYSTSDDDDFPAREEPAGRTEV